MAQDKLAVVTGAAGGMGGAAVARLVRDGYRVAAMDINKDGLARLAAESGGAVTAWPCDQTDEAAVRRTIGEVIARHGGVSALVNLTGWAGTTRFHEETSDYWRKVIAINFESMLYVTHAVLQNMIESKRGKIVLVASDAGRVGTSGEAVYAGTKGAVIAFAKSLARENARHKINVNSVCPGPTDTPLLQAEMAEDPELIQRMVKIIPFRRVATPKDIAGVIAFLCSEDSDYMTGQTLSVSGGLTMV
ncbi:MAG: SDR family NAD(P)-dependent oxidoreductase [Dongiaceae bacterium]